MELTLKNEHCAVTVTDAGAMLRSLVRDGREYLWQGDPAYWAGQAPVCFPIVGVLPKGASTAFGKPCRMKRHGVARINPFTLTEHHRNGATFTQVADDNTLAAYPFDYRLEIRYELVDSTVAVTYHIINSGGEPMPFVIGGHPAFQVPEGKTIYDYTLVFNKEGKEAGNHQEELHYLAPNDQGYQVEEKTGSLKLKDGQVPVTKGFFDQILTYMFDGAQISSVGLLVDETPYVTIDCGDFPYLGVWTIEATHPFVCLEPWYGLCAPDGYKGELKDRPGIQKLEAWGTWEKSYSIRIE